MSVTGAERESIDALWEEVRRRDGLFFEQKSSAKPVDEVVARLKAANSHGQNSGRR